MPFESLPQQFQQWKTKAPDRTAYAVRTDGGWETTPWRTFNAEVWEAARAFMALGLQRGDTVAILGFNRPCWTIFDMASMTAGGVPVGIYTSCSTAQVQYIAAHAEASFLLVEHKDQWEKVAQIIDHLPALKHVVMMPGDPVPDHPLARSWEAFIATAKDVTDDALAERLAGIQPDDLASLIYTSGTTGPPKGVMLSHRNLVAVCGMGLQMLPGDTSHVRVLSYLPLCHVAERDFTIIGPAQGGYAVYYATSVEELASNLVEVQPDFFMGVPRVWEKMYAAVSEKLNTAQGMKRRISQWAMQVGRRVSDVRRQGLAPQGTLAYQHGIADKLFFSKVKKALGLGNAEACLSGAAPLSADVIDFFGGLDLIIQEVYGQTEGGGPTTFTSPGAMKVGTVGKPFRGVEVRLAADGEILFRGDNVFQGYYKDPEATAATLVDGWIHTGDLGAFDEDGLLRITGRKKEIIITAGGKNITPRNIEEAFKTHPLVGEAVVVGDRRKYLTLLITLDPDLARAYAEDHSLDPSSLHTAEAVRATLEAHRVEVNASLSRVEQIKKFAILPAPFTIGAGELTPTLKLKRTIIHQNHADTIEALYAD